LGRFDETTARQEPVRLRFYTWEVDAGKPVVEKMLADFNETHSGIEVVHESAQDPTYQDLLYTAVASGDPADVFYMWWGALSYPLVDAGYVLDLSPYYEKYKWNDILIPWVSESMLRDGKKWAVPRVVRGMGFWYRTDIFAANGIEVPTTYAEIETACQTLKEQGIYALSLGGKFGWNTMRLTDYFLEMAAGPDGHDQLNRMEMSWDSPPVIEAFTLLRKWVDEGWVVPDFLTVEPSDARLRWYEGAAAMVFEGDWMEGVIRADEQDIAKFDFFLPPTGHEPMRYSAFTDIIMIAATTEHPEEAAEFVNWWISPETQKKYLLETGGASATLGALPNPDELPRVYKWRQIIENSRATYLPTDTVFEKELAADFFELQDGVIAGQFSPEEGAKLMQERIDEWKASNPG